MKMKMKNWKMKVKNEIDEKMKNETTKTNLIHIKSKETDGWMDGLNKK